MYVWQFLLAALCVRVLYSIVSVVRSPTRRIPGPFLARFTRLWYFYSVWGGNHRQDAIELHRRYATDSYFAPIVRLGPNMFSIADADKRIYGIASKMQKSSWYSAWSPSPDKVSLFSDQDVQRHNKSRKKFQSLYTLTSVLSYEKYVDECTTILADRMSAFAKSGPIVDLARWCQFYAFDVITDITYGERLGFMDEGIDVQNIIKSNTANMFYGTMMGIYPELHYSLFEIMQKIPGSGAAGRRRLLSAILKNKKAREEQRISPNNEDVVQQKMQDIPRDVLDKLLDMKEGNQKGLTDQDVVIMLMSNIVAGADTTAFAICGILYSLIKTPQAMQKLRTEIRGRLDAGFCGQYNLPFKVSQEMPYLQACIKEGLRIHAATRLPFWRTVNEGGIEISGTYLPAGSDIGVTSTLAHINPDVWGAYAETFLPERWIEAEKESPEQLKAFEHNYMPWGHGSRTCIGQQIAILELSKVVPILVHNFDLQLTSPDQEWASQNYWMPKWMNAHVHVKKRQV